MMSSRQQAAGSKGEIRTTKLTKVIYEKMTRRHGDTETEVGSQRSEVRGRKSEIRDQRSEKKELEADLLRITYNTSDDFYDFYEFYEFYEFYDLNGLNGLSDLSNGPRTTDN